MGVNTFKLDESNKLVKRYELKSRREVKRDRISRIGHDGHITAAGQMQLYL